MRLKLYILFILLYTSKAAFSFKANNSITFGIKEKRIACSISVIKLKNESAFLYQEDNTADDDRCIGYQEKNEDADYYFNPIFYLCHTVLIHVIGPDINYHYNDKVLSVPFLNIVSPPPEQLK